MYSSLPPSVAIFSPAHPPPPLNRKARSSPNVPVNALPRSRIGSGRTNFSQFKADKFTARPLPIPTACPLPPPSSEFISTSFLRLCKPPHQHQILPKSHTHYKVSTLLYEVNARVQSKLYSTGSSLSSQATRLAQLAEPGRP
eukprot:4496860-Pleurochrysis_carterae.AAC.2